MRGVLHRERRPLHVHQDDAGARRATTPGMAGSKRKALVSLTISAPASRAAWATAALVESTERRVRVCWRRPSMTGGSGRSPRPRARAGAGAGALPADVDDVRAVRDELEPRSTAFAASKYRPPSENESGVTLTMPMSQARGPKMKRRP